MAIGHGTDANLSRPAILPQSRRYERRCIFMSISMVDDA